MADISDSIARRIDASETDHVHDSYNGIPCTIACARCAWVREIAAAIREAVAAEREACIAAASAIAREFKSAVIADRAHGRDPLANDCRRAGAAAVESALRARGA